MMLKQLSNAGGRQTRLAVPKATMRNLNISRRPLAASAMTENKADLLATAKLAAEAGAQVGERGPGL